MVPAVRLKSFLLLKSPFLQVLKSPMRTMRLGLRCKLLRQQRYTNRGRGVLWMLPLRRCRRHGNLSKPHGFTQNAVETLHQAAAAAVSQAQQSEQILRVQAEAAVNAVQQQANE